MDAEFRAEIARLKDTHDQSKAGQLAALEQMGSQARGELNRLHDRRQAIHDRLGQHAGANASAIEPRLKDVDAELRAEIARLKDTHD